METDETFILLMKDIYFCVRKEHLPGYAKDGYCGGWRVGGGNCVLVVKEEPTAEQIANCEKMFGWTYMSFTDHE